MSDSDNDLLPGNVFSFQNENTTVCARGPNVNTTTLTGISFRNKISSTNQMARDFERQRYLEPYRDQRSIYCRRDISPPMSLHSGSDFRLRSFQHSYYPRGLSCQRSMINGRSGSPTSVRSIDSNASVATDIAVALKNGNFNRYDFKVIKEAYNKFLKRNSRKRVEKRRNRRLFLKGHRRKSGNDSVGSDSSISDDDCRSTSTTVYKDNMSSCRSTRINISEFRQSIKENNLYNDHTDRIRQNSFRNMFNVASRNTSTHTINKEQCLPSTTQKDRFRTGFPLPSQRFNQSLASVSIPERQNMLDSSYLPINHRDVFNQSITPAGHNVHETDSDQEEIFPRTALRGKSIYQSKPQSTNFTHERKRCLESSDHRLHNNKRSKLSSPKRNETEGPLQKNTVNGIKKSDEFQFVKPQIPARKSGNTKSVEVEDRLLAKSAPPLTDILTPVPSIIQVPNPTPNATQTSQLSKLKDNICSNDQSDDTQLSTTDVSMRPSFIKRKLYTQKHDVMESKNLSSDNIVVDSPQTNVYSSIQKEKNRARKLVTNQSCLSRDVQLEDNNLLELIHKIVPPDRMNVTNKTDIMIDNSKNKLAKDDKWDVTSILSTCNNDDVSDTYTDEEIFKVDNNRTKTKKTKMPEKKSNNAKILAVKLPHNKVALPEQINSTSSAEKKDATKKGNVYNCVKSFWDTDLESDMENNCVQDQITNQKENYYQGNFTRNKSFNHTKGSGMDNTTILQNDKMKSSTLTTNNIINHVKKLNLSLSLMKKTKFDGNRVEHCQSKETKESTKGSICNAKGDTERKLNEKKVLDSHNSLSETSTHHNSILKTNNTKGTPRINKNSSDKQKPKSSKGLDNSKLISDTNKKPIKAITKKSQGQVKKNNVNVSKINVQSPKAETQESKKSKQTQRVNNKSNTSTHPIIETEKVAKRVLTRNKKVNSSVSDLTQNRSLETNTRTTRLSATKSNTDESGFKKGNPNVKLTSDKGTRTTAKSKGNNKSPAKSTTAIDSIANRKSPRTPKGFKQLRVMLTPSSQIKISKTSAKEAQLKGKKPLSHMKTFLDNNNSTLSDGTLDEILKQNSVARSLRSARNKIVVTPNTRSRTAGHRN